MAVSSLVRKLTQSLTVTPWVVAVLSLTTLTKGTKVEITGVRLNSILPGEGLLEIDTVSNKSGNTTYCVCNDWFTVKEACVICRNLGFGRPIAFGAKHDGAGSRWYRQTLSVHSKCTGFEARWAYCPGVNMSLFPAECAPTEHVEIKCAKVNSSSPSQLSCPSLHTVQNDSSSRESAGVTTYTPIAASSATIPLNGGDSTTVASVKVDPAVTAGRIDKGTRSGMVTSGISSPTTRSHTGSQTPTTKPDTAFFLYSTTVTTHEPKSGSSGNNFGTASDLGRSEKSNTVSDTTWAIAFGIIFGLLAIVAIIAIMAYHRHRGGHSQTGGPRHCKADTTVNVIMRPASGTCHPDYQSLPDPANRPRNGCISNPVPVSDNGSISMLSPQTSSGASRCLHGHISANAVPETGQNDLSPLEGVNDITPCQVDSKDSDANELNPKEDIVWPGCHS